MSLFPTILETIIKFGETKFSVSEPKEPGELVVIKIPVIRQGDTSKVSIVRVHTKDGSATSGEDYHPVSEGMEAPRACLQRDGACTIASASALEKNKRNTQSKSKYTYSYKLISFIKTKTLEFFPGFSLLTYRVYVLGLRNILGRSAR